MFNKEIYRLKKCISDKIHEFTDRDLEVFKKEDKTLVTEFDLYISEKVKKIFSKANLPYLPLNSPKDGMDGSHQGPKKRLKRKKRQPARLCLPRNKIYAA